MVDKSTNLNERVGKLGFPVLEVDRKSEATQTLAEVVKSKNDRLWEGFPVMLANVMDAGLLDYERLRGTYLHSNAEVSKLHCLMALSLALYRLSNVHESWMEHLTEYVRKSKGPEPDDFVNKLKSENEFSVCGRQMSSERLFTAFRNYYVHEAVTSADSRKTRSSVQELLAAKVASDLNYSLSQVFSPKQKQLVLKKFRGEKLTKTEQEYFSRSVKKKLMALTNQELHQLAVKILG